MLITRLLLIPEVWDGKPTYRKSLAGNLLVLDLTFGPSFSSTQCFIDLFMYLLVLDTGERLEQHTVEAFLKEGVIMKNFNHPHVLRLLGVCVNDQENPMVILPYMANGDLRSYVKDKKKVH